jgi:hypothetical protein
VVASSCRYTAIRRQVRPIRSRCASDQVRYQGAQAQVEA